MSFDPTSKGVPPAIVVSETRTEDLDFFRPAKLFQFLIPEQVEARITLD